MSFVAWIGELLCTSSLLGLLTLFVMGDEFSDESREGGDA